MSSAESVESTKALLRQHEQQLRAIPGVEGFAVGYSNLDSRADAPVVQIFVRSPEFVPRVIEQVSALIDRSRFEVDISPQITPL